MTIKYLFSKNKDELLEINESKYKYLKYKKKYNNLKKELDKKNKESSKSVDSLELVDQQSEDSDIVFPINNLAICVGKRDGVSGCRTCCSNHFSNSRDYASCVNICMNS